MLNGGGAGLREESAERGGAGRWVQSAEMGRLWKEGSAECVEDLVILISPEYLKNF